MFEEKQQQRRRKGRERERELSVVGEDWFDFFTPDDRDR